MVVFDAKRWVHTIVKFTTLFSVLLSLRSSKKFLVSRCFQSDHAIVKFTTLLSILFRMRSSKKFLVQRCSQIDHTIVGSTTLLSILLRGSSIFLRYLTWYAVVRSIEHAHKHLWICNEVLGQKQIRRSAKSWLILRFFCFV